MLICNLHSPSRLFYWKQDLNPLAVFENTPEQFLHPDANALLSVLLDPSENYIEASLQKLTLEACNELLSSIVPNHMCLRPPDILQMPQSYSMVSLIIHLAISQPCCLQKSCIVCASDIVPSCLQFSFKDCPLSQI